MSYPAIWLATATVGRHRCPQKRLQTARQPPVYPNSSPDHRACNSLTPFRCPHAVHPCPSVDSGLVDGSPRDRILVLNGASGAVITHYEAPGDNTNGLAFHNGSLYAVTNEQHPQFGFLAARLHRMTTSTGAVTMEYDLQAPFGGLVFEQINGLASDGNFLYAGVRDEARWFITNPNDPNSPSGDVFGFGPFSSTFYVGSLEIVSGPGIPTRLASSGFSDRGQVITRFDPAGGDQFDQFLVGNLSIEGMAQIGTNLYLADGNAEEIFVTTLPDNQPETTIVGDFDATLSATTDSGPYDSEPASFEVVRNTDVQIDMTDPAEAFATTSAVIPIRGRVSDPAVEEVTVGVILPVTNLFEDAVPDGDLAGSDALWDSSGVRGRWHIDCDIGSGLADESLPFIAEGRSPSCGWRFGDPSQSGYGEGERAEGSLQLADTIVVGPGTRLRFNTWYATEPVSDADIKVVEVAVVTTDVDGNDEIGEWQAIVQIVGPGFQNAPIPEDDDGNALFVPHPNRFVRIEMDQRAIDFVGGEPRPRFQGIDEPLTGLGLGGGRTLIRFRFDSRDGIANGDLGWYVDDIVVEGAGFKGKTTATVALDPPIIANGTTWYRSFDTTFTLVEGENEVITVGRQPYLPDPAGPRLFGRDSVTGFLDLTGPALGLSGIDPIVGNPVQALQGTIDDINLASLEIVHEFFIAPTVTSSKTVFAITKLPSDGTFSTPVGLFEGVNTFVATGIDGSGNVSSLTFEATLDTAGPSLTVQSTTYPLGFKSARAGDLVVFNVTTTDNIGVERVLIKLPDGRDVKMPKRDEIPQAVLSQWQATGDYVFPLFVPAGTAPGAVELQVTAVDEAANQSQATAQAVVVATLEGFSFNLMPGQNLISLPLKPSNDVTAIPDLLGSDLLSKIEAIMYYDASSTAWRMYVPDATSSSDLLTMETGKGYFVKMKDGVHVFDAPLGAGLPQTPRPIVFSYEGEFLAPGTLPPTYPVEGPGWNLVGFHSENVLPVTTALQSLESPDRIWASLLQYDNLIEFTFGEEEEEDAIDIVLGAFRRVLPTGDMVPGKGYWLFMVQDGVVVP